ncbi:hypothetical protein AMAG_17052 [Allomyces macrogynus ATCC 38327]|uniref:BTB domain-containing protein n=1 Tax=Allomyces macrogynus (strain ATCC 38327) TaxID=578462 RepID=A0A0L0TDG5_ALLM3|nr:hypothetical protein AMAG_17052 [Allomyces macrogynus ATCC 38327]|eukprot:KNE72609.1 hypothetical protein AMAG_17052 [Allomyces macrogynus ATCC 38327]
MSPARHHAHRTHPHHGPHHHSYHHHDASEHDAVVAKSWARLTDDLRRAWTEPIDPDTTLLVTTTALESATIDCHRALLDPARLEALVDSDLASDVANADPTAHLDLQVNVLHQDLAHLRGVIESFYVGNGRSENDPRLATLQHLLDAHPWADCTLVLDDATGQVMADAAVHKFILAARVPYFETLIYAGFAEAGRPTIKLPLDVFGSPTVFDNIVSFIYLARLKHKPDSALQLFDLFRCANFLGLDSLETHTIAEIRLMLHGFQCHCTHCCSTLPSALLFADRMSVTELYDSLVDAVSAAPLVFWTSLEFATSPTKIRDDVLLAFVASAEHDGTTLLQGILTLDEVLETLLGRARSAAYQSLGTAVARARDVLVKQLPPNVPTILSTIDRPPAMDVHARFETLSKYLVPLLNDRNAVPLALALFTFVETHKDDDPNAAYRQTATDLAATAVEFVVKRWLNLSFAPPRGVYPGSDTWRGFLDHVATQCRVKVTDLPGQQVPAVAVTGRRTTARPASMAVPGELVASTRRMAPRVRSVIVDTPAPSPPVAPTPAPRPRSTYGPSRAGTTPAVASRTRASSSQNATTATSAALPSATRAPTRSGTATRAAPPRAAARSPIRSATTSRASSLAHRPSFATTTSSTSSGTASSATPRSRAPSPLAGRMSRRPILTASSSSPSTTPASAPSPSPTPATMPRQRTSTVAPRPASLHLGTTARSPRVCTPPGSLPTSPTAPTVSSSSSSMTPVPSSSSRRPSAFPSSPVGLAAILDALPSSRAGFHVPSASPVLFRTSPILATTELRPTTPLGGAGFSSSGGAGLPATPSTPPRARSPLAPLARLSTLVSALGFGAGGSSGSAAAVPEPEQVQRSVVPNEMVAVTADTGAAGGSGGGLLGRFGLGSFMDWRAGASSSGNEGADAGTAPAAEDMVGLTTPDESDGDDEERTEVPLTRRIVLDAPPTTSLPASAPAPGLGPGPGPGLAPTRNMPSRLPRPRVRVPQLQATARTNWRP